MNTIGLAQERAPGRTSPRTRRRRWELSKRRLLTVAAVVCLAAAVVAVVTSPSATRGLASLFGAGGEEELLTYTARVIDFDITVLASGMLESASTKDVLSEVEGQVGILSLLERGTRVKKGDIVVELDSAALKTALLQQRVSVQQAKVATAQATEAHQLAKSQAESDVRAAELTLKFAELDLRKYLEGDYPQEQRLVQSEITLAEEELKRAKERIKYSEELKGLGYLSEGQVDADRLAVLRSEEKLKLARETMRLLEQFTYARMKEDLESKATEAQRALARDNAIAQASVEQAVAQLDAQKSTLELEDSKLVRLQDQISKCTLRAPQDGVVLYPMPEDEDEPVIKQGALVRQRQHVFTIPNTEAMQVSASVHEAVVHLVKPGKPARIWADSFPDRELQGRTKEISLLPDLQSWRKSTVNFYPAKILIEDEMDELRPGMNAKVQIMIEHVKQRLAIPVHAVVRSDKRTFCIVLDSGRPQLRRIELGKSNEQFVEVKQGLGEGEAVVLSPDQVPLEVPKDDETVDAS